MLNGKRKNLIFFWKDQIFILKGRLFIFLWFIIVLKYSYAEAVISAEEKYISSGTGSLQGAVLTEIYVDMTIIL